MAARGGVIYKYTNLENGKVYIGMTSSSLSKRANAHKRLGEKGNSRPLYQAFRKYGLSSFSLQVIGATDTREALSDLEKSAIEAYDSTDPDMGYNILKGGDGWSGLQMLGDVNPSKRPEVRAKFSGANHYKARAITYMGVEFPTIMEASRVTGTPYETIRTRLASKGLPRTETHYSKTNPEAWTKHNKAIGEKTRGIKRPQSSGVNSGKSKPVRIGELEFDNMRLASEYFKVHTDTIKNWIKAGKADFILKAA